MVHAMTSAWDVMRQSFQLNHEVTQPEVQTQLRWLMSHPSYLDSLARSEPYLYHIVTEIQKRHIPGEMALIPMIESSYDPFAYSGAGAAGLWQLMPGTGTELGLKRDWWVDARRSIGPSTDAALNYLLYLHQLFNHDWIMAVAAYDAGEGSIDKIIKRSGQRSNQVNFWTLAVPRETKAYIPRLLALAEIIQNPARYHVTLPEIPYEPYFEEVSIGTQIDLNSAAKLAGISYRELIQLNPGYNHWTTAPYHPYKLLIPADHVDHFSRNLAQLKSVPVKTRQAVLMSSTKPKVLRPAIQTFRAVKPKAPHFVAGAQYKRIHIVQSNDSYASITKKYGVTMRELQAWNRLRSNVPLRLGQSLVLLKSNRPAGDNHNKMRG